MTGGAAMGAKRPGFLRSLLLGSVVAAVVLGSAASRATETVLSPDQPVLIRADELVHDRDLGTITARGNVEVSNEQRVVLADTISYNERADTLTATGNVTFLQPTGEVIFAEYVEISSDLKDGVLRDLRLILSDGARAAANSARRSEGNILELDKGVYSPCEPCKEDPTRAPLWQIKAVTIVHDQKRQTVDYTDAWLEVAGIPVLYTPYLSHPDPTVGRRSGFLMPSVGTNSDLGFLVDVPYYFNIASESDATVTATYTGNEGPVLSGKARHLLHQGELKGEGSITRNSDRKVLGHLRGSGRFDVDDTWRWGFDADRTVDDTYLRRYGFSSSDTLTSRLFAEGFRQRNYFQASAYSFQGMEAGDVAGETPYVLPMVDYSHVGEPNRLGARESLDVSLVALTRTEGRDTRRLSVRPGWQLPYVGPAGDVYVLSASVQGDLYHLSEHTRAGHDGSYDGFAGRIVPQTSLDWSFPLIRQERNSYMLVEPMVSGVISPYGGNPEGIPNEDSLDFELDDTNVLLANRFTGFDRVEGGPRVNYGMRWGLFGAGTGYTTVLVGQSFRLKADSTYGDQSGLEDNFSDIVGKVHVSPGEYLDLFYRTRFDKSSLSARRNEVNLLAGPPSLRLNAGYAFFESQPDSEFPEREELNLTLSSQFTRFWRGNVWSVSDLADGEMRSLGLNLTYEDECFVFAVDGSRRFFADRDLKPTDSVMFRLVFKTLGEVQTEVN